MANKETGQASTPIDEDSVNEKVNRIITVMEENLKSMKDRMSLLEEENIHLRARVSELEGNSNVFPTNETQKTPLSPMSQQPNLTHEDYTQSSKERLALSPMSQQPNLTNEDTMNESDDETHALDTQRPSNPNQDGKPDDEVIFILEIIFCRKETREMNETPSSPIAPKSIETPFILQVRLSRLRESHRMTRLPLILKFLLLI
uniref:Uncharacterized protein n=1 Tax=Brassica campestris TaxID=3711 RepID=A0A3P6BDM5_BRACM|nr:unnamed protein product [Brassica rapa]